MNSTLMKKNGASKYHQYHFPVISFIVTSVPFSIWLQKFLFLMINRIKYQGI